MWQCVCVCALFNQLIVRRWMMGLFICFYACYIETSRSFWHRHCIQRVMTPSSRYSVACNDAIQWWTDTVLLLVNVLSYGRVYLPTHNLCGVEHICWHGMHVNISILLRYYVFVQISKSRFNPNWYEISSLSRCYVVFCNREYNDMTCLCILLGY